MILDYNAFNCVLITTTAVVTTLALVIMLFLYCKFRCGCCRRSTLVINQPHHSAVLPDQRKEMIRLNDHEFDYIDDRSTTNVISSSVRVTSLRDFDNSKV